MADDRDPVIVAGLGTTRTIQTRWTGRLLFGCIMVTLGILWTLDNLGLADASSVLRWWPSLLVAYGLLRVTGVDGVHRPVSGSVFLLIGGWMLLRELDIVQVSIFHLWPVILILLGAAIMWRSLRAPSGATMPRPFGYAQGDDRESYPRPFAFMGGAMRNIQSTELVGFEATAIMGGLELDLRNATPRGPEVIGEVFAWWGGIEVLVPETWRVVCEATPIMGAVVNSARAPEGPPTHTLVVRGLLVMGGIEIRNTPARHRRHVYVNTMREGRRTVREEVRVGGTGVIVNREESEPRKD
jgi:hypothetical protein